MQEETRNYSSYVNRVSQSVDEGHELGRQAAEALEKIVLSANESATMSGDMVRVTKEQAAASEMVSSTFEHFTQGADMIRRATSEEAQTAKFIRESIETAKRMVEKVYGSTEEQNKTAQMLNETVLKAEETAGSLQRAMERERKLSGNIHEAVEQLRTMSHGNFGAQRGQLLRAAHGDVGVAHGRTGPLLQGQKQERPKELKRTAQVQVGARGPGG